MLARLAGPARNGWVRRFRPNTGQGVVIVGGMRTKMREGIPMDISRRDLAIGATMLALAAGMDRAAATTVDGAARKAAPTGEKIAMLIYPGVTALDLVGPLYAMGGMMGAKVQLVGESAGPIRADRGLGLVANAGYDDVPSDLDMLFVPGAGPGIVEAIRDDRLLGFLSDRGGRAKLVTSVCTGSLLLGAAGLLKGYRATSHWAFRDAVLPLFGATPVNQRYVVDRNRITGGGVTAGLDFGLRIVAQLRGEAHARITQLLAEYDPDPPFAGSPEKAKPETVAEVRSFSAKLVGEAKAAIKARAVV